MWEGGARGHKLSGRSAVSFQWAFQWGGNSFTSDQGLATGNCRTRTDRSVTVTSAPLSWTSSILGQMAWSNVASAVASSPSLRIRITDGLRSPLARKQSMEISVECDTQTRESARGSLQDIEIARAPHTDLGHMDHVPAGLIEQGRRGARQALVEQEALHMDSPRTGDAGWPTDQPFPAS
jgi:hypothetical protein